MKQPHQVKQHQHQWQQMEEELPRVMKWMKTICLILKRVHTGFQQSPVVECYTSQPVISDGLFNYSFRNRSESCLRNHYGPKIKIGVLMLTWILLILGPVKTENRYFILFKQLLYITLQ